MILQSDIELRELRDFNISITQQLSQIAAQQGELQSPMQILFSQVWDLDYCMLYIELCH